MDVALFDFDLPPDRIALNPIEPREAAKLLVVSRKAVLQDRTVGDLPSLLHPGDALVFNDTKVIPAFLEGKRLRKGAPPMAFSASLHMREAPDRWQAFVKGARKLTLGERVCFGEDTLLHAEVVDKKQDGQVTFRFDSENRALDQLLAQIGKTPLPPYIASRRKIGAKDREAYQTIYAKHEGAVAAPTAGLHFTAALLERLAMRAVSQHFVTLHVGAGTFLPVKTHDTKDHVMHAENGFIGEETAEALNAIRARGGRIVAVGTTSLRLLESASDESGTIRPFSGPTDLFITPGYRFRAVDLLMTNFHTPRSTLFMLVCAFCGLETAHQAYAYAIQNHYRFYSYGDASLLIP